MSPRTDALPNGALIAIGALGIVDNVLLHRVPGLHRAVEGKTALAVEHALIAGGALMLAVGLWRKRGRVERSARSFWQSDRADLNRMPGPGASRNGMHERNS